MPLALLMLFAAAPAAPMAHAMPAPPPTDVQPAPDPYFTIAYDPAADASVEVDLRLARAKLSGKRVLLVMGTNRCHDSAWFANLIDTPRFVGMVTGNFEVVFVDVNAPQIGQGRNLHIAKRFGFKKLKGTPTIAVLDANGRVLNRKAAPAWRNAASRTDDATYAELAGYAAPVTR
jgi:hypothetical protein